MNRNTFGPNLRRRRVQRGVTLDQIAAATKVARELFEDLERNDLSRWPAGIYARAYIRQYAYAIGLDPDSTVDEFCRWFDQGDRRAERIVREQSQIVGHSLDWQDDVPRGERRGMPPGGENESRRPRTDANTSLRIVDRDRPAPQTDDEPSRPRLLTRLKRAFSRT